MIEYQPFVPPLPREYRPKRGFRKPLIDNGDGTVYWPLACGRFCLIDEADVPLVSQHLWITCRGGESWYAATRVRGPDARRAAPYLHQLLMGQKGVDHINGDGLHCRRCNMRPATSSENNANAVRRRNNRSGIRGVHFNRARGKWCAQIMVNRSPRHLGYYDAREAAAAYDRAAREAWPDHYQTRKRTIHRQPGQQLAFLPLPADFTK